MCVALLKAAFMFDVEEGTLAFVVSSFCCFWSALGMSTSNVDISTSNDFEDFRPGISTSKKTP